MNAKRKKINQFLEKGGKRISFLLLEIAIAAVIGVGFLAFIRNELATSNELLALQLKKLGVAEEELKKIMDDK